MLGKESLQLEYQNAANAWAVFGRLVHLTRNYPLIAEHFRTGVTPAEAEAAHNETADKCADAKELLEKAARKDDAEGPVEPSEVANARLFILNATREWEEYCNTMEAREAGIAGACNLVERFHKRLFPRVEANDRIEKLNPDRGGTRQAQKHFERIVKIAAFTDPILLRIFAFQSGLTLTEKIHHPRLPQLLEGSQAAKAFLLATSGRVSSGELTVDGLEEMFTPYGHVRILGRDI